MSFPAGATLSIDLRALVANWRMLADVAAPAECGAVVKADAYGTGLEHAVCALARAGCRTFFVAHVSEGIRARAVQSDATIYILNGLLAGAEQTYLDENLRPVLGSAAEVERWGRGNSAPSPAALHVDTGMNRLGLAPDDGAALLAASPPFPAALLMSHFVSAEDPGDQINDGQTQAFEDLRRLRPDLPASLANSSGIFLGRHTHHDLVRPGFALYGGNPTPAAANPMQPVVRLEAEIILVRDVEPGATVGYNAQWTARRPSRLATIGVGYADGYPRAASSTGSGGGAAMVAGVRCPLAGRVSMDLIVLDVTDVPASELGPGAKAVLIGDGITVDDVGRFAGTLGYEILTNLGRRYRRTYDG